MRYLLLLFLLFAGNVEATNWCEHASVEGCWLFDVDSSTQVDSSSNGVDGTQTQVGGTDNQAWISDGYKDGGWDFQGVTSVDYMDYGSQSFYSNSNLTFTFWVYLNGSGAGDAIMGEETDASNKQWQISITDSGVINYLDYDGTGGRSHNTTYTVSTGTWEHIAYTVDGTTVKVYAQGVSRTLSSDTDNTGGAGTPDFKIGVTRANDGQDFWIDEVGAFSTDLDATDINEIMNFGLIATGASVKFKWFN